MLTTPSHDRLLAHAEHVFRAIGTLPLDVAMKLMEHGFDVNELERQWDKEHRAHE